MRGLKRDECIMLQLWRFDQSLAELKAKHSECHDPCRGSVGESVSFPFQVLEAPCVLSLWSLPPSPQTAVQHLFCLNLCLPPGKILVITSGLFRLNPGLPRILSIPIPRSLTLSHVQVPFAM